MSVQDLPMYVIERGVTSSTSSNYSRMSTCRSSILSSSDDYVRHRSRNLRAERHAYSITPERLEQQRKIVRQIEHLKRLIIEKHPEKKTRFSLSHMRHVGIPPVVIPEQFDCRTACTLVAGKNVPFTRNMWHNQKKNVRHLDVIVERYRYS
uniref:Uncharacterized protein AlNc14C375G11157 n=1 Tax=Albugo laibachii Nc14 TaxID=890382 RepID=F0WY97_9STRA|nr:conserved hypothetical protein [Albugo laibachii Nc14]|eukprot:CCA26449.1 conserved hypothetical protein [Albugo laibachii Nc14]